MQLARRIIDTPICPSRAAAFSCTIQQITLVLAANDQRYIILKIIVSLPHSVKRFITEIHSNDTVSVRHPFVIVLIFCPANKGISSSRELIIAQGKRVVLRIVDCYPIFISQRSVFSIKCNRVYLFLILIDFRFTPRLRRDQRQQHHQDHIQTEQPYFSTVHIIVLPLLYRVYQAMPAPDRNTAPS